MTTVLPDQHKNTAPGPHRCDCFPGESLGLPVHFWMVSRGGAQLTSACNTEPAGCPLTESCRMRGRDRARYDHLSRAFLPSKGDRPTAFNRSALPLAFPPPWGSSLPSGSDILRWPSSHCLRQKQPRGAHRKLTGKHTPPPAFFSLTSFLAKFSRTYPSLDEYFSSQTPFFFQRALQSLIWTMRIKSHVWLILRECWSSSIW